MTSLRTCLTALADLALPTTCAACGVLLAASGAAGADGSQTPGSPSAWCRGCEVDLRATLLPGGGRRVRPRPCPATLPPAHAAARYEPPLSHLVAAYKDEDRRDVADLLGPLLGVAVDAAVAASPSALRRLRAGDGPVLVVPVPASRAARRRRGDAPLVELARRAVAGWDTRDAVVADALAVRRRVADQAGLGARQRAVNLEHSMAVRPRWEPAVRRAHCVVVDDVLTTGATLVEAARALRAGGCEQVVAATVCATSRRTPGPSPLPACSG